MAIAKRTFDMLVFSYSLLVKFARELQDLLRWVKTVSKTLTFK